MPSWDELSPGVKRYLVVGGILLVCVLGFRMCASAGPTDKPVPRGVVR